MAKSLGSHFATMPLPKPAEITVDGPATLLEAFVNGCDSRGRFPRRLWVRLMWWQAPNLPDQAEIEEWFDALIEDEHLRSDDLYHDLYGGDPVAVLTLRKMGRYARFLERPPIPRKLRDAVYARDGNACLECGRTDRLSLDHKKPYSLGGEDTYENLQTLCVWCNSKKGAKT